MARPYRADWLVQGTEWNGVAKGRRPFGLIVYQPKARIARFRIGVPSTGPKVVAYDVVTPTRVSRRQLRRGETVTLVAAIRPGIRPPQAAIRIVPRSATPVPTGGAASLVVLATMVD